MRIITGKFKGRILAAVPDKSVRPATDRVKGIIFNVLQSRLDLSGVDVLDIFAGSGSLGFEALSRGAESVVFVEESSRVLRIIRKNAEMLGCTDSCELIQTDALSYVKGSVGKYDLIFADPPYAYGFTPLLPEMIFKRGMLNSGGYLIIEHAVQTDFESSALFELTLQKASGRTRLSFFHRKS